MDITSRIALFICCIAFTVLLTYVIAEAQKNIVRLALADAGCTEVSISFRLIASGRGSNMFKVAYLDARGVEHLTACTIRSRSLLFGGADVYWKESPR